MSNKILCSCGEDLTEKCYDAIDDFKEEHHDGYYKNEEITIFVTCLKCVKNHEFEEKDIKDLL